VIGHGIDINKFQLPNYKLQTNSKFQIPNSQTITILSVGRITPSKGHDLVIKSVADLIKIGYNLNLKIIGGVVQGYHQKYQESLKKLVAELGVLDKVEFTGAVNYDEMPKYYERAEILVDAVPPGGFDKVILEAMACGTIPITSNGYIKPVFPENLRNEIFFSESSQSELSSKLKLVIDSRLWENEILVLKLRNIVVENYSLGAFIDKIFHVFNELAK